MTNFENFKACLNNMSEKERMAVADALMALNRDAFQANDHATAHMLDDANYICIFEGI